jgi:hypothetical protein
LTWSIDEVCIGAAMTSCRRFGVRTAYLKMTDMSEQAIDWFPRIGGEEHILLGRDSSLRSIPVNVDAKQAFYLDGMRHAVEIMDVSFGRLRSALTRLARHPPASNDLPGISAGLFLDAWAMVDAIDRFRTLYHSMPGMKPRAPKEEIPRLYEALQPFRELRNVGDHVAQRADFVLARDDAALGELTWLTGARLVPTVVAWHCVLRPGTLRKEYPLPTDPIETTLDWPTDNIRLIAGGFEGNLSAVRAIVAGRVRHLEAQLVKIFAKPEYEHAAVMNDFFGRRPVRLASQDEADVLRRQS